jgi:hypothetical protein
MTRPISYRSKRLEAHPIDGESVHFRPGLAAHASAAATAWNLLSLAAYCRRLISHDGFWRTNLGFALRGPPADAPAGPRGGLASSRTTDIPCVVTTITERLTGAVIRWLSRIGTVQLHTWTIPTPRL